MDLNLALNEMEPALISISAFVFAAGFARKGNNMLTPIVPEGEPTINNLREFDLDALKRALLARR